eukprot:GILJ01000338.1.p1 GENE.GILJ01000338.1~~GILJ01000338.1.p1  ORF type:complete len:203 (-),score=19.66 GILJ01000338.1:497-1030(-)
MRALRLSLLACLVLQVILSHASDEAASTSVLRTNKDASAVESHSHLLHKSKDDVLGAGGIDTPVNYYQLYMDTYPAGTGWGPFQLQIQWTAPQAHSGWDWIGIFKVGESSYRNSVTWQYVPAGNRGTITFAEKDLWVGYAGGLEPGKYEFRYYPYSSYDPIAKSGPFNVALMVTPCT